MSAPVGSNRHPIQQDQTMSITATAVANVERKATPLQEARQQIDSMEGQFRMALPAHVPTERFMRVVMTALGANQDLLKCTRASLLAAAMKAAQDGLLPDGRDAAFVSFAGVVQYMPMIGGILKKVRNSGELKTITAQVAYEKDKFFYRLGDDEMIEHEPFLDGDRGKPRLVYAIARTKSDGIYREIMTVADVEKVRSISKAKNNGPWVQWWDEMAKKTVLRRLSKRLPMSTDLDDIMRRDDDLYDLRGAREEATAANGGRSQSLVGKLDALAAAPSRQEPVDEQHTATEAAEEDVTQTIETAAATPRETLLDDLRAAITNGKRATTLLNALAADQRSLLTDDDVKGLKDASKAFSEKDAASS